MVDMSEEKFFELAKQCQETIEICNKLSADLFESVKSNHMLRELLDKSTADIHVLLAFIKNKGLQPPKIQSKLIN